MPSGTIVADHGAMVAATEGMVATEDMVTMEDMAMDTTDMDTAVALIAVSTT